MAKNDGTVGNEQNVPSPEQFQQSVNPDVAPTDTENQAIGQQEVPQEPQLPTAIFPQSAVISNDPSMTGMTTVSPGNLPTATTSTSSVVNAASIQSQSANESIPVNGQTVVTLQNKPTRIDSVTLNGQTMTLAQVGTDLSQTVNQVMYDAEQGALVFAKDVSGLVQVAYAYAPRIEQSELSTIVAWMHERLLALEGFLAKLRGSNYV